MKKFCYVYILISESDSKIHYTGITEDFKERLAMHNRGKCADTAPRRPWQLETTIAFTSEVRHAHSRSTSKPDQDASSRGVICDFSSERKRGAKAATPESAKAG